MCLSFLTFTQLLRFSLSSLAISQANFTHMIDNYIFLAQKLHVMYEFNFFSGGGGGGSVRLFSCSSPLNRARESYR